MSVAMRPFESIHASLPPDLSALLGDAWLSVRGRLRSALWRYFAACTDAARVDDAVSQVESDTYATVARWLLRGSVDPSALWSPALWICAAREIRSRYFQSLRIVINGSPVRPLGELAEFVAERLPSDSAAELDPAELLDALCGAYLAAAADADDATAAWVAETLAAVLYLPDATNRERAEAIGVRYETFRSRLRRIRAALCVS